MEVGRVNGMEEARGGRREENGRLEGQRGAVKGEE